MGERLHDDFRVKELLSHFDYGVDEAKASSLLNSLLASYVNLTWNPKGEIVYQGRTIPNTKIAELVEYCVSPYFSGIPEPAGLNVFVKGLADINIDKDLIENVRVLTMLAREEEERETESENEETASEEDSKSDYTETQSENSIIDEPGDCEHCQNPVSFTHVIECPKCLWKYFNDCVNRNLICDVCGAEFKTHDPCLRVIRCTVCPYARVTDRSLNNQEFFV